MTFTIAHTIDDAVTALAAGARPIAGGSDPSSSRYRRNQRQ